jgi:hypothetical protein
MKLQLMNEQETKLFIENRLKNGEALADLFAEEAVAITAAYIRGN